MFYENLIALNPLNRDPNLRGETPLAMEVHLIDPAAMVAGVITVDAVSKFGKGKGELWGILPLANIEATNEVIGTTVAAHASTTGSITITINSTDATSTTDLDPFYAFVIGKIIPVDPS